MKLNKLQNAKISICLVLFILSYAWATPQVTKIINETMVDSNAMTLSSGAWYGYAINGLSFQQEAIITHNGWQYVTYYNEYGYVCVARRELPSGSWQIIGLTDYIISNTLDAHNVVTIGICPNDGTIHLAFDHHGSPLNYRVSEPNVATNPQAITWQASLFGPVRNYLEEAVPVYGLTYPTFWQTPDGNLQMGYRYGGSGDGDIILVDYDGNTGLWHDTRMVISRIGTYYDYCSGTSHARNAYMNSFTYGPDGKLHATWCWREHATMGANHDIMYAYSEDGGYVWLNGETGENALKISTNNNGNEPQTILTLNFGPSEDNIIGLATGDPATEELITLDSPGVTVVDINSCYGMMNQQTQAVDPQGRIHTVMWHCTDETYLLYPRNGLRWGPQGARQYFHYWRDSQSVWHRNELPVYVGSRPKLFIRSNGDAFLIYQSRLPEDENPTDGGIYFIEGNLTICAATAQSQWTDWQTIHVEPGPFLNEMLGDPYRLQQDDILSVMVQESPWYAGQPTPLRILDFSLD